MKSEHAEDTQEQQERVEKTDGPRVQHLVAALRKSIQSAVKATWYLFVLLNQTIYNDIALRIRSTCRFRLTLRTNSWPWSERYWPLS